MPETSESTALETMPSSGRVHVIGAGPVGLVLTALLQPLEEFSVRLYEKRHEYTRTRMVRLAPYLVADSVESYQTDSIDGDSVGAVFDPAELDEGLTFRQSMPDPTALLRDWTPGVLPAQLHRALISDLIDARGLGVERNAAVVSAEDATAMLEPGDILIDSTGSQSSASRSPGSRPGGRRWEHAQDPARVRARHHLPVRAAVRLQRALQVLQEHREPALQVHPMVHRTHYDGSVSHVTGIVNTARPRTMRRCPDSTGSGYAATFPEVAESMDRFIGKVKEETHGGVTGDLEVVRIPLDLYARNATSRQWLTAGPRDRHPFASSPVFLAGDSPSARRTFSRSRSASSVRCIWRDSWPSVTFRSGTCSIGTSCTRTSNGSASTCAAR